MGSWCNIRSFAAVGGRVPWVMGTCLPTGTLTKLRCRLAMMRPGFGGSYLKRHSGTAAQQHRNAR